MTSESKYPDAFDRVPRLCIIVPVYNEEASLGELAGELKSVLDSNGITFETIFVDDGSTDRSWEVIQTIHEDDDRFEGIRFRRNYGKSAALSVGFVAARGEYVATLDADLQDDPAELPEMLSTLESGYDLVNGWKQKRRDPVSKKVPSRFFNFVTRTLSGIPLHDFNCGIKMYRREVVETVRIYGELHRYVPLLAKWEGFDRIAEQPVQHRPRKYGDTKFGLERFIRGFLDLLTVLFMTRFARRPMHFFGSLGTIAFIGGFLISLYLTYEKVVLGHPLGDRPLLLLGALLILLGAQMFLTGLLGEMVVRPRMENPANYDVVERTAERRSSMAASPAAGPG